MDESAIDRARDRVEQRADSAVLETTLDRARRELAAVADAAAKAAAALPGRVETALHEGLREQVAPVGRNLAEIRGLSNQVIRRLDAAEDIAQLERHARVDDLAVLVELVSSAWQNVDARLDRIEETLARLAHTLEERAGATVYRLEDHRADAAGT